MSTTEFSYIASRVSTDRRVSPGHVLVAGRPRTHLIVAKTQPPSPLTKLGLEDRVLGEEEKADKGGHRGLMPVSL